jgi:cytochrome P450
MLPHSFLFGHLITIGKHMAKYPSNLHGQCLPNVLQQFFPDICARGLVYLDIWPISPPMLAVFHPDIMSQFTVAESLPKHEHLHNELDPFTQCLDLVSSEGQLWKTWRAIFNPGFSAKNLIRLVPDMVEEVDIFRDWLREAATSGEKITLAEKSEKLTVDIIGRTVL